jgi:hypothetical protein
MKKINRVLLFGTGIAVVGLGAIDETMRGVYDDMNESSMKDQIADNPDLAKAGGIVKTSLGDRFLVSEAWRTAGDDEVCVAGSFELAPRKAKRIFCLQTPPKRQPDK